MTESSRARYRCILRVLSNVAACILASSVCFVTARADTTPATLAPRGPSFALPSNPVIESWMAEVSADSLNAYVVRMVDFGTRNTASDTTSSTRGIGAARNWLHDRFADFGGTGATAGFFDYQSTVCSVFGPHRNVTLTKTGTLTPDRNFLVLGHLDSRTNIVCDITSDAPGANDDASGVAALMELARILSDETFESTLVLVGTTGEEQGLFGSTQQASAALAEGTRIDGVLNNDVIGNITGCVDPSCPSGMPDMVDSMSVRLFSSPPDFSISRQLTRAQKLQQERHMPDFAINLIPLQDRPGRGGDHIPFAQRGFAATRFTEAFEFGDGSGDNGWQHNAFDLVTHMNFDYLARNTQLNLACVANFLLAPESPPPAGLLNLGNGTLRVTWDSVVTAPDVAGYRVAFRFSGDLFYFDIRDAGLDPGPVQTEDFAGLPQDEFMWVSVSAYDSEFNESVFCPEQSTTVAIGVNELDTVPDGLAFREVGPMGAGSLRFELDLPHASEVGVQIYDVQGRLVRTLVDGVRYGAGSSIVRWDARNDDGRGVRPGVYLAELSLGGRAAMTLKTVYVE